jgi:DNA polymerase-3 subunit epsilon
LLLARRLLPQAPDHKLGTLTRWAGCPMPDAPTVHWQMRAWRHSCCNTCWRRRSASMVQQLDHQQLCQLQKVSASKVADFFMQHA